MRKRNFFKRKRRKMDRKFTEKKSKWQIYLMSSMQYLNKKIDIGLTDQNLKVGQFQVVVRL